MRVFIWADKIDNLILENGAIGGLNVQMYFWAKVFLSKGWDVITFSEKEQFQLEGITFVPYPQQGRFRIVRECFRSFAIMVKYSPDVVLVRGARRDLAFIAFVCRFTKTRLIFMGASDVNFIPGRENISGNRLNQRLYRFGLRITKRVVVQNKEQQVLLKENYGKKSLLIPNIWLSEFSNTEKERRVILWVGNFRSLKRPVWFLNLAKQFPDERFVMVGNRIDGTIYDSCVQMASTIPNLDFLGGVSFSNVNELFSESKLLVCTSEYEGFPNTFLQAWAQRIPVVSTVNPSQLISEKGLGLVSDDEESLVDNLRKMISDDFVYQRIRENIATYFEQNHLPEKLYTEVVSY